MTDTDRVISLLQREIAGDVIFPEDASYEAARRAFYGSFNRRPAAIAQPANATDVARVIRVASETGLELAVRSGGHSPAGHGTTEGGILIDLSHLTGLEVDASERLAWAGTGLTAAQYTEVVGLHGLATGFGDTGSVESGVSRSRAVSGIWSASMDSPSQPAGCRPGHS